MKSAIAIKIYMEKGTDRKCTATEVMTFKKSMSTDEFDKLGEQAANALGVKHEK